MCKSECFNYDGLVYWLKRNLVQNLIPQFNLSAKSIAMNFSRINFTVTEEDVMHAMEEIGIPFTVQKGERLYSVSFGEQAHNALWKTFN